jgi:hypothetical protein
MAAAVLAARRSSRRGSTQHDEPPDIAREHSGLLSRVLPSKPVDPREAYRRRVEQELDQMSSSDEEEGQVEEEDEMLVEQALARTLAAERARAVALARFRAAAITVQNTQRLQLTLADVRERHAGTKAEELGRARAPTVFIDTLRRRFSGCGGGSAPAGRATNRPPNAPQLQRKSSVLQVLGRVRRAAELARERRHLEPFVLARRALGRSLAIFAAPRSSDEPLPGQLALRLAYESTSAQVTVALLIFLNFGASAIEAQLLPALGTPAQRAFTALELFFNGCFSAELALNMYAHFLRPFWCSGWNLFDVAIVAISWLSLLVDGLPGIGVLRLFRAFRVFRLVKRVESLRLIVDGVLASATSVSNAVLVLLLILAIFAVIAVEFFGTLQPALFGTFGDAALSLYQAQTGDSWGKMARAMTYGARDIYSPYAAPFFVVFTFATSIVMANVVVAALLDTYLQHAQKAATERAKERARAELQAVPRTPWEQLQRLSRLLTAEGQLELAREQVAAKLMQRAGGRWITRVRRRRDKPERLARAVLIDVLASTAFEVFSEGELSSLCASERLGLLAPICADPIARELLGSNGLIVRPSVVLAGARLSAHAALLHGLLVKIGASADLMAEMAVRGAAGGKAGGGAGGGGASMRQRDSLLKASLLGISLRVGDEPDGTSDAQPNAPRPMADRGRERRISQEPTPIGSPSFSTKITPITSAALIASTLGAGPGQSRAAPPEAPQSAHGR